MTAGGAVPITLFFFRNRVPQADFSEVDRSVQTEAQAMLERSPVKEITRSEAMEFSRGRLKADDSAKLRFYLVRAVRLVEGGKFNVFRYSSSIYILHRDLGKPRPGCKIGSSGRSRG
jgi:hypothetical protein